MRLTVCNNTNYVLGIDYNCNKTRVLETVSTEGRLFINCSTEYVNDNCGGSGSDLLQTLFQSSTGRNKKCMSYDSRVSHPGVAENRNEVGSHPGVAQTIHHAKPGHVSRLILPCSVDSGPKLSDTILTRRLLRIVRHHPPV
jgi:hypothetical protein